MAASRHVYGESVDRESDLNAAVEAALGIDPSRNVRLLGEGQFCVAVLAEPDLVIRFPRQLGNLLDNLAGLTGVAVEAGATVQSFAQIAGNLTKDLETYLVARLSDTQRARALDEIRRLAMANQGSFALCHTDLGGNLVWDRAGSRLGVIDFGDALVSDAALDLASLAALDQDLATAVANRRDGRLMPSVFRDDQRRILAAEAKAIDLHGVQLAGAGLLDHDVEIRLGHDVGCAGGRHQSARVHAV